MAATETVDLTPNYKRVEEFMTTQLIEAFQKSGDRLPGDGGKFLSSYLDLIRYLVISDPDYIARRINHIGK